MMLNKHIIKALSALVVFAASAVTVTAMEGDVTYVFENKTVEINVETGMADRLASVYVVPGKKVSEDNTIATVTKEDIESGSFYYKAIKTDSDGKIALDINISDAPGGKYQAFVFVGEASFTDAAFLHTNIEEINTIILEDINPAATAEEITLIISNKCDTFGYDEEEILQVGEDLGKIVYASRPTGGYSGSDEFEVIYNKAMSIIEMRNSETPSDYMESNGRLFGISCDDYKALAQTVKDDFAARIMQADFLSGSIDRIIKEALYLAIVNSNADYTCMKEDALLFAEFADVELADAIAALDEYEKGLLFKDLYKSDYSSTEDFIAAVIRKSPQYANISGNVVSGSSGGSGGSGGSKGGGGGFSVPSKVQEQKQEPEQKPAEPEPEKNIYSDMSGHWAESIINELSNKNIISGYADKSFRPDNNITRAEFAKILVCINSKELTDRSVFEDVLPDAWYYKYVATANDMGIIMGSDGRFNPDGLITRQDAAVMICRYAESVYGALEGEESFGDINDASDYAVKSIKLLAANNLINGSDGNFYPLNNTTRAEAAAFIYKLISFAKEV